MTGDRRLFVEFAEGEGWARRVMDGQPAGFVSVESLLALARAGGVLEVPRDDG